MEEHATAELRKDKPEIYNKPSILLGNIFFLTRVLLFHMIIVACATMDGLQCVFLISFEFAYLIIITRNFVKYKYLLSIHMFFSKFIQGFFLFSFQALCLYMALNYHGQEPPVSLQRFGLYCIVIAMIFEYIFMVVAIIFIVKNLIQKMKEKTLAKERG